MEQENIIINRSRMDADSYSKEIIDVVDTHSKLFYIRANKSSSVYEQIRNIQKWEIIEINHKEYEVASIPFTQFFKDRNYRLVIMRGANKNGQAVVFTGDAYIYRTILTNDLNWSEKEIIEFYNARGASKRYSTR